MAKRKRKKRIGKTKKVNVQKEPEVKEETSLEEAETKVETPAEVETPTEKPMEQPDSIQAAVDDSPAAYIPPNHTEDVQPVEESNEPAAETSEAELEAKKPWWPGLGEPEEGIEPIAEEPESPQPKIEQTEETTEEVAEEIAEAVWPQAEKEETTEEPEAENESPGPEYT